MAFLDILFPRLCLGCGRHGRYFCSRCRNKIYSFGKTLCPMCERPSVNGATHFRCRKAWGIDGLAIIFSYRELVRKAIIQLKYRFVYDLADELSSLAAQQVPSFLCDKNFVFIVVPLHKIRLNWRGFNQAEVLGEKLASKMSLKFFTDILVRNRITDPQVSLAGDKRRANIQGAFAVNPCHLGRIKGKKFIIFDDVWTTGSTMRECALVLKRAGASSVWGLALAS